MAQLEQQRVTFPRVQLLVKLYKAKIQSNINGPYIVNAPCTASSHAYRAEYQHKPFHLIFSVPLSYLQTRKLKFRVNVMIFP